MKARFRANDLPDLIKVIQEYVQPGKYYILELSQKRTLSQNDYYYSVVVPLFSDHTGYSKKKAHLILTREFLSCEKDGKQIIRSTADLSAIEFEGYIRECNLYLYHDFNISIPKPNQVDDQLLTELEKIYLF